MRLTIVSLFLFLATFSGFAQDVVMEPAQVDQPNNKAAQEEAEFIQYQRLIANQIPGSEATAIDLQINENDWNTRAEEHQDQLKIGHTEHINLSVDLNAAYQLRSKRAIDLGFGTAQHNNLDFVWTGMIMVESSTGIRLHIQDFDLPEGAELYVYSDLGQSFGPYTNQGPNGKGAFWTDTLFAELIWVQLEMPRDIENADLSFSIDQLAHFNENFVMGREYINYTRFKTCQGIRGERVESCFANSTCYKDIPAVSDARGSVAFLNYKNDSDGDWYMCTGNLINASGANSSEPFMITAGHCIDSDSEANSVSAYFDYRNSNCSSDPDKECGQAWKKRNKVSGADLMVAKNNSDGDYSLLKLSGYPNGSYVKLGWTTANKAYSDGEQFYRVSHPRGYQQQYSLHEVDSSLSICSSDDRPEYIYTRHIEGYTEGGSSGSAMVNSGSKVVGTDTGRCRDQVCVDSLPIRDSSFRTAFYSAMSPYLKPTYTKVKSIVVTIESLGFGQSRPIVQIQVVDQYNTPVSNVIVQSSLSGPYNTTVTGITGADGWATINGPSWFQSVTWTACPTSLSHAWLTYNASQNAESCDSN